MNELLITKCGVFIQRHITQSQKGMNSNRSESVLVRWMNVKPVLQSEVSQKEKNIDLILMHIYGI